MAAALQRLFGLGHAQEQTGASRAASGTVGTGTASAAFLPSYQSRGVEPFPVMPTGPRRTEQVLPKGGQQRLPGAAPPHVPVAVRPGVPAASPSVVAARACLSGGKGGLPLADAVRLLQATPPYRLHGLAACLRTFTGLMVAAQVVVLIAALCLGGFAPPATNPLLGPGSGALSAVGAKNAALIAYSGQVYRFWTVTLVHVGLLHLAANAACALTTVRACEYAWGWRTMIVVYAATALTATALSCVGLPNTVSAGASGALCGVLGALAVQLRCEWEPAAAAQQHPPSVDQQVRVSFWRSLLVTALVLAVLSYWVDWAAHLGGALGGAALGLFLFAGGDAAVAVPAHMRSKLRWGGLAAYLALTGGLVAAAFTAVHPSRALLDLPINA
jgi:membrane associated rhomboid family serine protease